MTVEQKPKEISTLPSVEKPLNGADLPTLEIRTIFQNAAYALHDKYDNEAAKLLTSKDFSVHFKQMFEVPDGENATEFVITKLLKSPEVFRNELKTALQKYSMFLS